MNEKIPFEMKRFPEALPEWMETYQFRQQKEYYTAKNLQQRGKIVFLNLSATKYKNAGVVIKIPAAKRLNAEVLQMKWLRYVQVTVTPAATSFRLLIRNKPPKVRAPLITNNSNPI